MASSVLVRGHVRSRRQRRGRCLCVSTLATLDETMDDDDDRQEDQEFLVIGQKSVGNGKEHGR